MAKRYPVKTDAQRTLVICPAVFLVLATIAVIFRFRSRRQRKQQLLYDDWLCVAGLVMSYFCYVSIIVCVVYGGLGQTIGALEQESIFLVFKALTSVSVLWCTTVATVQMAILSLYIRIFKVIRWHRYACYGAMAVVFSWWASTFVTLLTTCIPLEAFWNPMVHGKCIKVREFCIASGMTHVLLDVFILTFPLPIIWKLKTQKSNKVTISVACLLGLFATIGGLLRMDCLIPILEYNEADFTLSAWIGVLFQILENTCGVICACAPMLTTYVAQIGNTTFATTLRRFISSNLSRTSNNSGGSGNSRRSGGSKGNSRYDNIDNPTIGSWGKNKIKKDSTFGVTTYEGGSQEYLAEVSANRVEGHSGRSIDIEMDALPQRGPRTAV